MFIIVIDVYLNTHRHRSNKTVTSFGVKEKKMGSGVSRGKKNNEMNSPPQSHPPIMVQSIPHTSISQNNQISPRNQSLHPQQHSNTSPQYIIPSPRRSIQQRYHNFLIAVF